MTTRDKLLHVAAQLDALWRELDAIGGPPSHTIGVTVNLLVTASRKIHQIAKMLPKE